MANIWKRLLLIIPISWSLWADDPEIRNPEDIISRIMQTTGVAAAKSEALAYQRLISKEDAWPDPKLKFNYSAMPIQSPWLGFSGMSGIEIGLSQTFPSLGSNRANIQVAKATHQIMVHQSRDRINGLIAKALDSYHQLGAQRELISITKSHIASLQRLEAVVSEKYRVGEGSQYQLLQTKLILETLEQKFGDLEAEEEAMTFQLNGLLQQGANEPIETNLFREIKNSELVADVLLDQALQRNPQLNQLLGRQTVEKKRVDSLEKNLFPPISASVSYRIRKKVDATNDEGNDFISVGLSMPIPWIWNLKRYGSQIRAAKLRKSAVEYSHRELSQNLAAQISGTVKNAKQSLKKYHAYHHNILPLARQSYESTLKAYEVNKAQYADIYAAELKIIEAEREEISVLLQWKLLNNKISALVGTYIDVDRT